MRLTGRLGGSVGGVSDLTLAKVMILLFRGVEPCMGLGADGVEPAWDPLSAPPLLTLSLPQK